MPKSNKTSNSFAKTFAGFQRINTFAPCSGQTTVFFCPIPETKNMVMVSFGATAAGLFWTVNVQVEHIL